MIKDLKKKSLRIVLISDAFLLAFALLLFFQASRTDPEYLGFYIILFAGVILIVWAIIRFVKALAGAYLKKFMKVISASGISLDRVEEDYRTAEPFENNQNAKIGRLFTYYDLGETIPKVIRNSNISWIHQETTQYKRNGVKTGTGYSICIYSECDDKKSNPAKIPLFTEVAVQNSIKTYLDRYPWIIAGYTPEISNLYHRDRDKFLNIKYNKYPRS